MLSFRLNSPFGRQSWEQGRTRQEARLAAKRTRRRRSMRRVGLGVWAPAHWLGWLSVLLLAAARPRASLVLENVALRQQLGVLSRSVKQPRSAEPAADVRVRPMLGGLHHVYTRAA
jgi:hypothetical protein